MTKEVLRLEFREFIETASRNQILLLIRGLEERNDDHAFDGLIEGLNRII